MIQSSQIWVGVINKGPNNYQLNSSYANRNSADYFRDLGETILKTAKIVPDGMLIFFPSYRNMNDMVNKWKTKSHYWESIGKVKVKNEKKEREREKESKIVGGGLVRFVLVKICLKKKKIKK